MTCEEAFKRLYELLNSDVENITSQQIEEHLRLCRTCCDYCKFNDEVLKAMQTSCFQKKASPELKSKIIGNLDLPA